MTKLAVLTLTLVSLLAAQASMAQPDDNPTIAWIKWGDSRNVALAEKAILDMLEVYGFISAEERALLDEEHSIEGERLNIIYGDALYDRIEANAIIDKALDRNADVFITFNTQMTQIVYYAIREFTDPPKLIFTVTSGPYITGVADASCVKPDFVIGTVPVTNYEDIVPLLLMQDPDMKVVGALYSPQQRASEVGVERITAIGESLGLTVVAESIIVTPDRIRRSKTCTAAAPKRSSSQSLRFKAFNCFCLYRMTMGCQWSFPRRRTPIAAGRSAADSTVCTSKASSPETCSSAI